MPVANGTSDTNPSTFPARLPANQGHRGSLLARLARVVLVGSLVSIPALSATVPALAAAPDEADVGLLRDYIHYSRIAQVELAKSNGEALLAKLVAPTGSGQMTLTQFVELVETSGELTRFEETTLRGQRFAELESVAVKLLRAYEQGKLEQARNADEIAKNIDLLVGTARQRAVARERLLSAGEYALPQLLTAFGDRQKLARRDEARMMMIELGRASIVPLTTAFPRLDPVMQEQVASVLGEIPVRTSLPVLYEVHKSTGSAAVRNACERAIVKIDGSFIPEAPIAALYEALAAAYFQNQDSLSTFPGEPSQLLWNYEPSTGLVSTPISAAVFHEAMAMRMAERSLTADPAGRSALALWVAANFKREIDTPADYTNPAYAAGRPDAMFYAVSAGPAICQRVLAMALDSRNVQLARRAIAALEKTAGAPAMAGAEMGRRPLLEALRFPNRRVQYEAALALAASQPTQSFDGAEQVVPLLARAVREAGARYAVVLGADPERRNALAEQVRGYGYTVLQPAGKLSEIETELASAPGIDLVLSSLPPKATGEMLEDARSRTKLATTPLVVFASAETRRELSVRFGRDEAVRFVGEQTGSAEVAEAIKQTADKVMGGELSPEDGTLYQIKSVSALRDLAVAGNPVFNVADAGAPLTASLESARGGLKLRVAEVLSYINDPRVQGAIVAAAMSAQSDDEAVALLGRGADSAKRFGNLLPPAAVASLVEASGKAGPDARSNAVAALLGSLNLQGGGIVPLILNTKPQ